MTLNQEYWLHAVQSWTEEQMEEWMLEFSKRMGAQKNIAPAPAADICECNVDEFCCLDMNGQDLINQFMGDRSRGIGFVKGFLPFLALEKQVCNVYCHNDYAHARDYEVNVDGKDGYYLAVHMMIPLTPSWERLTPDSEEAQKRFDFTHVKPQGGSTGLFIGNPPKLPKLIVVSLD